VSTSELEQQGAGPQDEVVLWPGAEAMTERQITDINTYNLTQRHARFLCKSWAVSDLGLSAGSLLVIGKSQGPDAREGGLVSGRSWRWEPGKPLHWTGKEHGC
jgi:hypothetical protein